MTLADHFRQMARNNAWSNHRLHRACERLQAGEFEAKGVSFFPSLQRTLNHILIVDWYYIDALEAGGRGLSVLERDVPCPALEELVPAQRASDDRLIAYCDALSQDRLEQAVTLVREGRVAPTETVAAVLAHSLRAPDPPPRPGARHAGGNERPTPAAGRVPFARRRAPSGGRSARARLEGLSGLGVRFENGSPRALRAAERSERGVGGPAGLCPAGARGGAPR